MRILFAFNHCWEAELASVERKEVPSHRLFTYREMLALGHVPELLRMPARGAVLLRRPAVWKLYQSLWALWRTRGRDRADVVIATHESAGLPLLLVRRLGLLRRPVLVLTVAACSPRNQAGWRGTLIRWLFRGADALTCYAPQQVEALAATMGRSAGRVHFVPLGVDDQFFSEGPGPGPTPVEPDLLAAVGTNEGKDFPTLVAALPSGCRLEVVTDAMNAAAIARAPQPPLPAGAVRVRMAVPIVELRDLYRRAALHVIPLADSQISSGQTVLLENMALGRPVIVTKTAATEAYVQDGSTACVVEPGNVEQLREAIAGLLADPARAAEIGHRAAAAVRETFSAAQMAQRLLAIIAAMTGEEAVELTTALPRPATAMSIGNRS